MVNRVAFVFACIAALVVPVAPARADRVSDEFGSLKYREIGPAISGGRTSAVAGSDVDARVYYAGGAAGGVFKSQDGGVSWRPTFDREAVAPIGALAVAPRSAGDVWAGTGETNPRNTVEEGNGVWHSLDGGATWQHRGLDDAGTVSSISIDPRNSRVVVVGVLGHIFRDGTVRGAYLTRDGGASWKRTLYAGPSSGVSAIARAPDHPSVMFAGVWQVRRRPWVLSSGGPQGGIYRSNDGGVTWRKLIGGGLPLAPTGRIGLACGHGGRVYALIQSSAGDLWRSDDDGAHWRLMPHSPLVGARPFYFSNIAVDPSDRDRLLVGSLSLARSTDGGGTFHTVATNAGWDYHINWWSADGRRIIDGNDEGVILSSDGGGHWRQPYDLSLAQPYHVGLGGSLPSYRVCAGLQDNNSWCGPSTSDNGVGVLNRDWSIVGPGDGMHALFDPIDARFIWTTSTNYDTGQVYVYDERTTQTRDVSPSARDNEAAPATLPYRFNWDTPIAFLPDGKALVGGNVLFESADRGAHWSVISPDLTRNDPSHQQISGGPITQDASGAETSDTILSLAASPASGPVIWAGTDDGLVQITRDGGKTWKNVTPAAVPQWSRIAAIELSHDNAGGALLAVDDHMNGDERPLIFETADFGASWRSVSGDLPPFLFVRVIREDPADSQVLYAGTQRGVFVSVDRGAHWHSLRLNMPATPIYDLQIQPDRSDLIVASHGRGIWILDDVAPLRALAQASQQDVVLFPPVAAYRMWQSAPVNTFTDSTLPDGDFVGDDRAYGAIVTYYLGRPQKTVSMSVLDAHGRTVKHLAAKDLTSHAGLNRVAWDLTEDGPVRWTGTFEENRGPKAGAQVVPGTYTIRLTAGGKAADQQVKVHADPRDGSGASDAAAQYELLSALYAELSSVDSMLNELDRRLARSSGTAALPLRVVRSRLTMDPRNIEDLRAPVALRERLIDLLDRVGATSFAPPTQAQSDEAAALQAEYQAVSAQCARLQ